MAIPHLPTLLEDVRQAEESILVGLMTSFFDEMMNWCMDA